MSDSELIYELGSSSPVAMVFYDNAGYDPSAKMGRHELHERVPGGFCSCGQWDHSTAAGMDLVREWTIHVKQAREEAQDKIDKILEKFTGSTHADGDT